MKKYLTKEKQFLQKLIVCIYITGKLASEVVPKAVLQFLSKLNSIQVASLPRDPNWGL
jgi:hypothetical protein